MLHSDGNKNVANHKLHQEEVYLDLGSLSQPGKGSEAASPTEAVCTALVNSGLYEPLMAVEVLGYDRALLQSALMLRAPNELHFKCLHGR